MGTYQNNAKFMLNLKQLRKPEKIAYKKVGIKKWGKVEVCPLLLSKWLMENIIEFVNKIIWHSLLTSSCC
jgi:hypothetical protein